MQKLNASRRQFLGAAGRKGDLAPPVAAEHLKPVWQLYRDYRVNHPGEPVSIGLGTVRVLLPEAPDIYAVDYRAGLLNNLDHVLSNFSEKLGNANPISRLNPFNQDGDFDDCVIRVMARIPVEWMQTGHIYSGWPFDVDEFVHQVERDAS